MIDPASPEYKKQYNPLTPLEDVFWPMRQDANTRVEPLSGSGNVGEIYDVEYFLNAFFGAATAPKAYFGFEGEINSKATLQQQDVRFARTLKRVQRATIFGIRQVLDIHFTLLRASEGGDEKYDFAKAANQYLVQMSPISYLDEFERIELVQMRYQLVESMGNLAQSMQIDARTWQAYVLLNFAKLPEDMVMRLLQQTAEKPVAGTGEGFERKTDAEKDQILDNDGRAHEGFFQLSEEEKRWIGRAIHSSSGLRKSIATFAELAEEEQRDMTLQQTDPSLLPVIVPGGGTLWDSYTDPDTTIAALNEDLRVLKDPKLLHERTERVQRDRRTRLAAHAARRTTPLTEVAP